MRYFGLLMLVACTKSVVGFDYQGDELALCEDTERVFIEHRSALTSAWGIDNPELGLSYNVSNAIVECGGRPCFANGSIYSPLPFDEHELIHSYLARFGTPPKWLEEGMAVAYDCGAEQPWLTETKVSFAELLVWNPGTHEREYYAAAGTFVASLVQAYGANAVIELYKTCATKDCGKAFEAQMGTSLELLYPGSAPPMCIPIWPCAQPQIEPGCATRLFPYADRIRKLDAYASLGRPSTWMYACDSQTAVRRREDGIQIAGPGTYFGVGDVPFSDELTTAPYVKDVHVGYYISLIGPKPSQQIQLIQVPELFVSLDHPAFAIDLTLDAPLKPATSLTAPGAWLNVWPERFLLITPTP